MFAALLIVAAANLGFAVLLFAVVPIPSWVAGLLMIPAFLISLVAGAFIGLELPVLWRYVTRSRE